MLPSEQLHLSTKEEIRWTMHAGRGTEMLAQSVVSMQDVEAECTLQEMAAPTAEDIALLTQEIGIAFGRLEEAFGDMDFRVESMDTSI